MDPSSHLVSRENLIIHSTMELQQGKSARVVKQHWPRIAKEKGIYRLYGFDLSGRCWNRCCFGDAGQEGGGHFHGYVANRLSYLRVASANVLVASIKYSGNCFSSSERVLSRFPCVFLPVA